MLRFAVAIALVTGAYPGLIFVARPNGVVGPTVYALAVTAFGCVVLGVPVVLGLNRRRACGFWQVATAGALVGCLMALPTAFFGFGTLAVTLKLFAFFGLLHAAAIWLLGVWRNDFFAVPR